MKIKYLAAPILALSTALSHAGAYIGVSVGQSDIDSDDFDDGNSLAISGGYKFNNYFSIEGAYLKLGESKDDIDPVWTLDTDGINVSAVGTYPVNEKVELFAKAGMFSWDYSVDVAGSGKIASNDGTDLSIGVGASMSLGDQFGLVFEYQQFDLDDIDVSNISLGARFNF